MLEKEKKNSGREERTKTEKKEMQIVWIFCLTNIITNIRFSRVLRKKKTVEERCTSFLSNRSARCYCWRKKTMRIPKAIPKWLPLLLEYVGNKDPKIGYTHEDVILAIEKHWESFVYENAVPPAPRSTKKKNARVDEKDLRKAADGCRKSMKTGDSGEDEEMLRRYKDQLNQLPESVKGALAQNYRAKRSGSVDRRNCPPGESFEDAISMPSSGVDESPTEAVAQSDSEIPEEEKSTIPWDHVQSKTDQLYGTFKYEAQRIGIEEKHPMVDSVDMLYDITKQVIDVAHR
jgi:hypothetical protein